MFPSGRSVRYLVRAIMAAVAILALFPTAPTTAAAGRAGGSSTVGSTVGYDISYPQCGGPFPANAAFGIVGVNNGIVFSPNPCLSAGDGSPELAWANGVQAQLYANTGNPGPALSSHWPKTQTSPYDCSAGASQGFDTANCAYDYGYSAAADSYGTAVGAYVSLGLASSGATRTPAPNVWWLDVETSNSWRTDVSLNVAVLEGAVAYLQSTSPAGIGFYSTQYQWNQITGGTTAFASYPSWVAGATTIDQAASNCGGKGFTGGGVALAQYSANGFDADLLCNLTGATYHPITPVRLLDTRSGNGHSGKLSANTPVTFQITGRDGIPSNATAVTGNVTVVGSTYSWAVYLGPDPIASPTTSTLNFNTGQVVANGVTVALGAGGTLSATYMSTAGNTTDLVFDVTGFFTPDTSGDTYHPISPVRLLDTRIGNGYGGKLSANTSVTFQITGREGIPANATAVTGNVTVVNETNSWAIYVGPDPLASPGTSTLNFNKGDVKANNLTVALSATGTLSATFMSTAGNTTDLVFDVTGYYTADTSGSKYVPITPVRLLDSRVANGYPTKLTASTPASFQIAGRDGVPANANAVSGNVTVVNETASWAIFVGPDPNPSPGTSTLNFNTGDVLANGIVVALSSTGSLSATYLSTAGNTTDLVFDVTGYFVP